MWSAFSVLAGCQSRTVEAESPEIHFIVASENGDTVAGVEETGRVRVWRLEGSAGAAGRVFQEVETAPRVPQIGLGVAPDGASVIYECSPGAVCSRDLSSGETQSVFEFGDPQDLLSTALVAGDADILVVGTTSGRIIHYRRSKKSLTMLKPKDVWSLVGAKPIVALEGSSDLEVVVTATSDVSGAAVTASGGLESVGLEPFVERGGRKEPRWTGLTVWYPDSQLAVEVEGGLRSGVRVDVSSDGSRVVVCEEVGVFMVLNGPTWQRSDGFSESPGGDRQECLGVRFLDSAGDWIARADHTSGALTFFRRASNAQWRAAGESMLVHGIARGTKTMEVVESRQWLLVATVGGGIDWYEAKLRSKPELRFLGHLD